MESPIVLDKPPEYHSKGSQKHDKGFPFDEAEVGEGAWSDLAARHPDIAARLRARPSSWARKRRSSHNQPGDDDDFGSGLGEHFNRFPFEDIPPEFREHLPSHWGHRYAPRDQTSPQTQPAPQQQPPTRPQTQKPPQNTTSTQTEEEPAPNTSEQPPETFSSLPQYGLRNTVDLGQKTPVDPSVLDAENERNQRSMSAPPDNRVPTPGQNSMGNMMGGNNPPPTPHQEQHQNDHASQSTVRHIPIFVEGRDEPIINKAHPDPATNFAEHKPAYAPPPPEREQYFERDPTMGFHHPPNFSRAFGTPFNKGFRQAPQPYAQQKVFTQPQNSPPQGRSQSPKPQNQHYTQVPVHHQQTHPPQQAPQQPQRQHSPQPQRQHSPQPQRQHSPKPQRQHSPQPQHAAAPSQQAPPPQQAPPQQAPPTQQAPSANDPITKILSIQKDVLDLMTEVENFVGVKSDKRYIYLDEMLTRNLIKLDDIETEGKENIRLARKEAIKCIQKCIAVLEAKAEGKIPTTPQPSAVVSEPELNGVSEQPEQPAEQTQGETKEEVSVEKEPADPEASTEETKDQEAAKGTPKKTKKVVKKRDKSKDKDGANGDKDMKKEEKSSDNVNMQMDEKGDTQAVPAQPMDTESSAASSQ